MKPTWDKLGAAYENSKTVIIADVDCTIEKDLCSKFGVRGYPTIKYFTGSTAADGDNYEGGRDYDALKTFVEENLGPSCGPANKDLCDEEQLAAITEVEKLSVEDIEASIKEKTEAVTNAETTFADEVDKLQARYKELMAEKDDAIAAVNKAVPSVGTLRGVLKALKDASEGAAAHDEL
jgi:thioredoxin-like negative regulator of GroEL